MRPRWRINDHEKRDGGGRENQNRTRTRWFIHINHNKTTAKAMCVRPGPSSHASLLQRPREPISAGQYTQKSPYAEYSMSNFAGGSVKWLLVSSEDCEHDGDQPWECISLIVSGGYLRYVRWLYVWPRGQCFIHLNEWDTTLEINSTTKAGDYIHRFSWERLSETFIS